MKVTPDLKAAVAIYMVAGLAMAARQRATAAHERGGLAGNLVVRDDLDATHLFGLASLHLERLEDGARDAVALKREANAVSAKARTLDARLHEMPGRQHEGGWGGFKLFGQDGEAARTMTSRGRMEKGSSIWLPRSSIPSKKKLIMPATGITRLRAKRRKEALKRECWRGQRHELAWSGQ
eukprot:6173188-Pleurochrysis_carterae.AAC.2